ncbi:MAG: DnaJ domain-containing protein [Coriobacteriales bacterium]|jgi:curved DNA-binding protein|nr:DnaJ domain-containing protein [Coriobacteriales bacterium]
MTTKSTNYYEILGIKQSASTDEIKKAFKKLARKHHPDAGGNEEEFKRVSEAYDTLSDQKKREQYDTFLRYGTNVSGYGGAQGAYNNPFWAAAAQAAARAGQTGGSGGFGQGSWQTVDFNDGMGGWSDIFSRIANGEGAFGTNWKMPERKVKGSDLKVELDLSFEDAFRGTAKKITIRSRDGNTRTMEIKVPAGAADGAKLRYKGKGGTGAGGGANGDLLVVTRIRPHELYSRKGSNVLMNVNLDIADAALGTSVTIAAPDGTKVRLRIPAGTEQGKLFVIKGKGAPKVKGEGYGDLKISAHIVVPKELNQRARAALEAYKEAISNSDGALDGKADRSVDGKAGCSADGNADSKLDGAIASNADVNVGVSADVKVDAKIDGKLEGGEK